ncbi:MAG TPA: hypothetical protein VJN02_03245 [Gammaproteobacteria bacterium]|nr:hypothetical protein [Gammaproteobacteria bacterium]
MMRVWIKGTRKEAVEAALARGVTIDCDVEAFGLTLANVVQGTEAQILAWFRETEEAPYAPGDLMLYRYQF